MRNNFVNIYNSICSKTGFLTGFFLLLGLILTQSNLKSQQLPVFSTFSLVDPYRNPAAILIPKHDDIQLLYSNSAPGFTDAPVSYYLGYMHPFKTESYQGPSFSLNNRNTNNIKNAIGGYLAFDQYGEIKQLSAMVGYAQNFLITDKFSVALGLSAGIYNYQIDFSGLIIKNQLDNTYARFINQSNNFTYLDANFGLISRFSNYKFEVSFNQFATNKAILSSSEIEAELISTEFFSFSKMQKLSNNLNYIPEISYYHLEPIPSWISMKNTFIYDGVWLGGLTYNHKRNVGFELGMIYQDIIIQYSFLINTNTFNVIGFTNHNLGFRYSINSSRNSNFEDYF